jgi:hypothetical protein
MAYRLAFPPGYQFLSDDGVPLSNGWLYVYVAGTSTPATTYSDIAGAVPHQNPAPLNAAGRLTDGGMYVPAGGYKFVANDEDLLLVWDQDNAVYDETA